MGVLGALSQELFRPLATLVAPGAAALAPYVVLLSHYHPRLQTFWSSDSALAIIVLLVGTIAAGLMLEDLGSRVEGDMWDQRLKEKDKSFPTVWDKYLKLQYEKDKEPLGQHYIRTILLRMKFELSFGIALAIALPGFVWAGVVVHQGPWVISLASTGLVALSSYLLYESYSSAKILARVRKLLVQS